MKVYLHFEGNPDFTQRVIIESPDTEKVSTTIEVSYKSVNLIYITFHRSF